MSNPTHDTNDAGGGAVDLDAIEAREKAATPGPWIQEVRGQGRDILGDVFADRGGQTATKLAEVIGNHTSQIITQANADFIMESRTDVPALVKECRRLRAFVASLKAKAQQSILILPRHFEAFERGETPP